jgi:hypothetical protein
MVSMPASLNTAAVSPGGLSVQALGAEAWAAPTRARNDANFAGFDENGGMTDKRNPYALGFSDWRCSRRVCLLPRLFSGW